ncbi:MAG: hypothetical protein DWQ37_03395 [Planctomycetota bacterium]|nr:MAG: hypothetical protein DWQ37_03395 [Planctomycetota bacterium]
MIGHGRPTTSRAPFARSYCTARWLYGLTLALAMAYTAPAALGEEIALRLRVAWGGGTERLWHGTIALSGGTLTELRPLGIEADEPGSIWLERGNQIQVRQRSLRAYDGIDVLANGDEQSRLSVWLSYGEGDAVQSVEVTLAELVEQAKHNKLDDAGNRLSISRSPGDRLRIEFEREHLVFAPGESLTLEVRPHLTGTDTSGLPLQARIVTNPGNQRVWSQNYTTGDAGTATSITLPVPQAEGVYDLTFALVPRSSIKQRLGLQKPILQRKIQFVVVAADAPAPSGEPPTARVVEINPANARWWERFAKVPMIPGLRKGPLGDGHVSTWNHPELGPMVRLAPGDAEADVSWEAYPLPIDHPGQVHVLEIEYPTDVPQAMGISLLEPNAAGAVMPIGLDSGLFVAADEVESKPRLARHRIVFWPRTKAPLLLLTNRRADKDAVYGKITVRSAPQSQLSRFTLGRFENGSSLPPALPDTLKSERLWAGYLDRPLVAENFSAPEALDGQSYRSLDDWNTFHQGGTRLIKYLKHVGYNGLMLSVLADGSTVYPSTLLEPTPRYDTGLFFASGQDPKRKDALELIFRLFDRESLMLIPALQFAAPLPELEERLRREGTGATGIRWIGDDGRPYLASHQPRRGLAPYYNLLDPRVQQAMLNVVREVITRYGEHPAYGGIAIQLGPEGYAQLPGVAWGLDDRTIARFEAEAHVRVPGSGPSRFAERAKYLTGAGPGREAWLAWRAQVVADFHRRLAREIAARHPQAKLYLAGSTMLDREIQLQLRPTLPRRARLDEAFRKIGIDVAAYAAEPSMVLLRPRVLRPGGAGGVAAEDEIYLSPEMDRLFAPTQRASLFYHEPQKVRLASFDMQSPFGAANTYAWLVSQMSPGGNRNRRRFVHALATSDAAQLFDGGWLLPLGQEDALRDILSVYRQLPGERFTTVEGETQPVTIRTLSRDGQTVVYLANDSPWKVNVVMQVDAPRDCRLEKIGDSSGVGPLVPAGTRSSWTVALEPHDLVAARLSSANVRVLRPVVSLPPELRPKLEQRIEDLVTRVRMLSNPQPMKSIENAGFEQPLEDEQIPGWTASAPGGGRVLLDRAQSHTGGQSILLAGTSERVSVASAPFEAPATGRLTVEVWLRARPGGPAPAVKIAVEGELPQEVFATNGVIPRVGESAAKAGDWVPYRFPIDNVPQDGLQDLRVRFELLGTGEVWVDDVQVFDLAFSEAELIELSKITSMASIHLDKRQLGDCSRLLEGYWPRFLMENVAPSPAATPLARRPKPLPPPPEPESKPGMLDSIRGYLPLFR